MRGVLISIEAYDPVARTTRVVRIGAARNSRTLGAGGFRWQAVLNRLPRLSMELLDDDMTGKLMIGRGEFTFNAAALEDVPNATALEWRGGRVVIYSGDSDRMADLTVEFDGRCSAGATAIDTGIVPMQVEVDQAPYSVPLLTKEYPGGTGLNGDVELKGSLRPAGFGRPINFPPVLVNQVLSIFQVDGYGNTVSIDGVFENLAAFGPSIANYSTYAALAAADIPEGRWATCLAEGLFRLGAVPVGTITADATFGAARPGSMMLRWLIVHANIVPDRIRISTFDALTAAVDALVGSPVPVSFWTTDSSNVLDLIQRMCASCNAMPLLLFDGTIAVSRFVGGADALTLNRTGGTPIVTGWLAGDPTVPWWRMRMATAKVVYVNPSSEIDYVETIVPRGLYDANEVYRKGNLVDAADGSSYLYIGELPQAGAAFPVAPETQNEYWFLQTSPTIVDFANVVGATRPQNNATVGAPSGTKVGDKFAEEVVSDLRLDSKSLASLAVLTETVNAVMQAKTTVAGQPVRTFSISMRTDVDGAIETLDLIGSVNADRSAIVLDMDTVRTDETTSLAQRFTQITGEGYGSEASISQLFKVLVGPDGSSAQGVLSFNVDGHIIGVRYANDGTLGSIVFVADMLALVDPNGGDPFTFLEYQDGVLTINGTVRAKAYLLGSVDTPAIADFSVAVPDMVIVEANGASVGTDDDHIWRDWNPQGIPLSCFIPIPAGAPNATIQLDVHLTGRRTGGDNDLISVRVRRADGSLLMPSEYTEILYDKGGNIVYPFPFTDPSPPAGGTTYTVQTRNDSGHPSWQRGILRPLGLLK